MRVMLGVAAGALLLATAGCREPMGFACAGDSQCVSLEGNNGLCFPIGVCGYIDPACSSGYRYSGDAPRPWTNTCVAPTDVPDATTSGTGPTTSGPSESTGSSTGGRDESSSSSGAPEPVCGNGVAEQGELCDDGNALEGDGCNPDCRFSALQLLSFTSGLEGDDEADAVMLTVEGDIVISGVAGDDPDRDGFIARYRPDGVEVWRHEVAGTAGRVDAVWALAPGPSGNVRALGQIVNEPDAPKMKMVTPREDFWLAELDIQGGEPVWTFVVGDPPPGSDRGYGLVTLPGGDIAIAARVGDASNSDFGVARFSVTDAGDGDYSIETVWERAFDGGPELRDFASAIAWDDAGRIIVGGTMEYEAADLDRHLRALDPDGNAFEPPCEDLGGDDDLAADDRIFGVAVGPSGEVVAVGRATRETEESTDAWLGYYPPGSCALEWTKTTPGAGQDADALTAVAIDELGNIVVGGYLNLGNTEDAWLAKYDSTSEQLWALEALDGPGNGNDRIESIAIGPRREITVAGRMTRPDEEDAWVARFTP